MYQSETLRFFAHFWWLIFPIGWMIGQGVQVWMRHQRAQHALDLIKTFADQGKEPPPQILEALRQPEPARIRRERTSGNYIFVAVILGGIAAAFALIAQLEDDPHVYFVVIILAATGIGFLAKALMRPLPTNDRLDGP